MEGRVAIVTGAGRGIGRAIATALAARGARVLAVSRTEADLAELASEVGVEYLAETVGSVAGCERIVAHARERLGPVSILVNNAGVGGYREAPIWEMTTETWRETLATNLDGPFELTRLAVPDMIRAGWGRVVMISSTAGTHGGASMPGYCASKHGVIGLARAVAQDVAPFGVTCNAILPGWVRTPMTERRAELTAERAGGSPDRFWDDVAAENPAGRIVSADEVASAVAFVAGEEASGVNGEALTVSLGAVW